MDEKWSPNTILVNVSQVNVIPVSSVVCLGSKAVGHVGSRWNGVLCERDEVRNCAEDEEMGDSPG